ncbi:hypothetical protein, partial [Tenacibaculum discolor]|uniref:hypothetical protein n=1 Tax=Tenacibaculum discolor TaxID=361581 RepID=UPI001F1BB4D7
KKKNYETDECNNSKNHINLTQDNSNKNILAQELSISAASITPTTTYTFKLPTYSSPSNNHPYEF